MAQNFGIAMSIVGGAIGAAVGNFLGATAGSVIGAIIGGITGAMTALDDNMCGNKGVFIDINWLLSVSVTPVCFW